MPIAGKERLVAGMSNRGLFKHRNRLGPLSVVPERLSGAIIEFIT
jgi:hypothetical protein